MNPSEVERETEEAIEDEEIKTKRGTLVEVEKTWYKVTDIDNEHDRLILARLTQEEVDEVFPGAPPREVFSGNRSERRDAQRAMRLATKRLKRRDS